MSFSWRGRSIYFWLITLVPMLFAQESVTVPNSHRLAYPVFLSNTLVFAYVCYANCMGEATVMTPVVIDLNRRIARPVGDARAESALLRPVRLEGGRGVLALMGDGIVRIDTEGRLKLVIAHKRLEGFGSSPDGQTIAFWEVSDRLTWRLVVVDVTTGRRLNEWVCQVRYGGDLQASEIAVLAPGLVLAITPDFLDRTPLRLYRGVGAPITLAADALAVVGQGQTAIALIRLPSGTRLTRFTASADELAPVVGSFDADVISGAGWEGTLLAQSFRTRRTVVWNSHRSIAVPNKCDDVAVSPDGHIWCAEGGGLARLSLTLAPK